MSLLHNEQAVTTTDIAYLDAVSVAMNHPPLEAGVYGVKYFDGSTGSEEWDGANWIGRTDVARYSGRPLLLSKVEKQEHVDTILGTVSSVHTPSASALALARHYASKLEKNRTGSKVGVHVQNMFGFYLLAKNLGMNFDANDNSTPATITDKKLLEWAHQEIGKKDADRLAKIMREAAKPGPALQAWLKEILA